MTTTYADDAADALATIADAGAAVAFVTVSPGTLDPTTETYSGGGTSTVTGSAIATRGRGEKYQALTLIHTEVVVLLFAADILGTRPPLSASVVWGTTTFVVASVDVVAPDGMAIVQRVSIVR